MQVLILPNECGTFPVLQAISKICGQETNAPALDLELITKVGRNGGEPRKQLQ